MDLFLIRHGETDANDQKIIQGWLDTDIAELNQQGREQAKAAADSFSEVVDALYVSDLKRAVQTAQFFCGKLPGIPYFEDSRLRERDFGALTGHDRQKIDWDKFWSVP